MPTINEIFLEQFIRTPLLAGNITGWASLDQHAETQVAGLHHHGFTADVSRRICEIYGYVQLGARAAAIEGLPWTITNDIYDKLAIAHGTFGKLMDEEGNRQSSLIEIGSGGICIEYFYVHAMFLNTLKTQDGKPLSLQDQKDLFLNIHDLSLKLHEIREGHSEIGLIQLDRNSNMFGYFPRPETILEIFRKDFQGEIRPNLLAQLEELIKPLPRPMQPSLAFAIDGPNTLQ